MDKDRKSYIIGGIIIIASVPFYLITKAFYRRKEIEIEDLKKEITEENALETVNNKVFGKPFPKAKAGKFVFIYDRLGLEKFSFNQKEESVIGKKVGTSIKEIKYIQEGNHTLDEACSAIIKHYYKIYLFNSLLSIGLLLLGGGQIANKYLYDKDLIKFLNK